MLKIEKKRWIFGGFMKISGKSLKKFREDYGKTYPRENILFLKKAHSLMIASFRNEPGLSSFYNCVLI